MNDDVNQEESSGLSVKQARLRAARRTRAAVSFVAIVFLTVFACTAYSFAARRSPHAFQAVFLMGIFGIALLILEPRSRLHRANELRILRFHKSPRFYGVVTVASTVLVLMFAFLTATPPVAKARPLIAQTKRPTPVVQPVPEVAPERQPPQFPELKVTGIIVNGERSSALVNSRTVQLGEYIGSVRLVVVQEDYVEFVLEGHRRVYPRLPPTPAPVPPVARR